MPTNKIFPGNTLQFVDPDGNVLQEYEYDDDNGRVVLQDDDGNLADQEVGDVVAESASVDGPLKANKHNTEIQIGATGEYDTLSAAVDDISPSASNPFTLVLREDIIDPDYIIAKSHVDVVGNGHTVINENDAPRPEDTSDSIYAVKFEDVTNARWSDITIRHEPSSDVGNGRAIWTNGETDDSLIWDGLSVYGHSKTGRGDACWIKHSTNPIIRNCKFVAGQGGGSRGLLVVNAATPTIKNVVCYGSKGDSSGLVSAALFVGDGADPDVSNVTVFHGDSDSRGFLLRDVAAGDYSNVKVLPKRQGHLRAFDGDGSEPFLGGEEQRDSLTSMPDGPGVLVSVEGRVVNPVSGATMDIGTTSGGSEIASGVDVSSSGRVAATDFNTVQFAQGDNIYVSFSHQSVIINLRWTVEQSKSEALFMDSAGSASFDNCVFRTANDALTASITAVDQKNYVMRNCSFETFSGVEAIFIPDDSGAEDPIYYPTVIGGSGNLDAAKE